MRVLDIQRMSTEDGPGLRTTVFLKGCPLACQWCHNPESISPKPHVEWIGVRCIGCRTCVHVCPQKGITLDEAGVHTSETCVACGTCALECPTGALELKGEEMSEEQLFNTLMKDRAYWGKDGGVTFSGGEATLQWKALLPLLEKLKAAGVHTAVDTCGLAKREVFEALLPVTDLFLYDLKIYDPEAHRRFTGQDNQLIFENFEYLVQSGARIWVRTPVIPGATDTDENIRSLASVIRDRVEKWELCAFNNLCRDKYERLGKTWEFASAGLMPKARMEALTALAVNSGAPEAMWSGATARETE
ncbi:MAG: glycyl-radical enzyme activating protein [Clostridia bacterium]|nr:glycyl-radical enzyme activating protein [Clostridia bacterium]